MDAVIGDDKKNFPMIHEIGCTNKDRIFVTKEIAIIYKRYAKELKELLEDPLCKE